MPHSFKVFILFKNKWGTIMTNPTNKYSEESFKKKVIEKIPSITNITEYKGVDFKLKVHCTHGVSERRGWSVLNGKHCCRTGYYESGKMWKKKTNDLDTLKERALKNRNNIDVSEAFIDTSGRYKRLANIKCLIHNQFYSSIAHNKIGLCPECNTERNIKQILKAGPIAWASQKTGSFVSKEETKWLDELGVKGRQIWLEDVKYKVDGYDSETNTVYLYHGRFWHGCPETYDPEMIHPIVKISMKDLYEKTMYYENKIKDAGYNLIVKWGT
jgi:hypothetical protein